MNKTIQTKRNAKAKSGFRKLHAKTTARKRKLRAATAMADPHVDLESDVPNVGIGRALIVILVLHVVAIAAIYAHSTFFGGEGEEASSDATSVAALTVGTADPVADLTPPAAENDIARASGRYIVVSGDTYSRIAHGNHVDETALRALNGGRPLRAGVVLDLPAELSSRPVDVSENPTRRETRRVAAAVEAPVVEPAVTRAVVVDERSAPRAIVVESAAAPAATTLSDSGKRYTVKSGDTVWRISHNHKVSSKHLLEVNGIKDASKLAIGRVLIIPTR
jgi:LysM repeat protein